MCDAARDHREEAVEQRQKEVLTKALIIGAILYSPCAFAQISGSPGNGAAALDVLNART